MNQDNITNLDERQQLIRNRVGFETMLLLSALLFLNGIVRDMGFHWAKAALTEALVLVYLGFFYFITRTIWQDAYQRDSRQVRSTMRFFFAIGLLNLGVLLVKGLGGGLALVENGALTGDITPLAIGGLFVYLSCLFWFRQWWNRRRGE